MQDVADADRVQQQKVEMFKDLALRAYDSQVGYGRWVLASLVTIQGGSLVLISQADKLSTPLFVACGPALLLGLATTVVTGGLGWVNFTVAANGYVRGWMILQQGGPYQASRALRWSARLSMGIAVFSALVSISSFAYASYRALEVIRTIAS